MRTIKAIATELAKRSGRATRVRVREISKILHHLSDLSLEKFNTLPTILNVGFKREKDRHK